MKPFAVRFAVVFGVWTLIAVCDAATQYLFLDAIGKTPSFWLVLRPPLAEQWIWAALTPLVFLTAHRFPLHRPALLPAFLVHAGCFLSLSLLHCVLAGAIGASLPSIPSDYHGSVLKLRFLAEIYSDIWMYWPLVCIQALFDSRHRTLESDRVAAKLEAELSKSSLALLRAQIQPHFLFNTLNAVSALIRIDMRAAEDMVADLAEVLRASFSDPASQETSLRRELELVRCYLRIQCRRFDRLRVAYYLAPDTLDASVPALVLQSLVENAVIHGIAPADRRGTIEIRAHRRGEQLILQVIDDGVGFRMPLRAGVGLSNARSRLQQLYSDQHSIDVAGEPENGVSVTVSIPFRILHSSVEGGHVDDENTHADCGRRVSGATQPVLTVEP